MWASLLPSALSSMLIQAIRNCATDSEQHLVLNNRCRDALMGAGPQAKGSMYSKLGVRTACLPVLHDGKENCLGSDRSRGSRSHCAVAARALAEVYLRTSIDHDRRRSDPARC